MEQQNLTTSAHLLPAASTLVVLCEVDLVHLDQSHAAHDLKHPAHSEMTVQDLAEFVPAPLGNRSTTKEPNKSPCIQK